ncbi:hypothetical protein [uncultured Paraglaciecola sp.]|uniref:hypothetical protein n=1 Tax=uncultured Paraglaciecola sp. TaxID=1765024 RepID=UPI00260461C1|nr:hypothetical protein [uncultured Paraglaciecola sp.]
MQQQNMQPFVQSATTYMLNGIKSLCFASIFCFSAAAEYISLFNIEDESSQTAQYVTYATQIDMLNDTNRLDVYDPNNFSVGNNVVGGGSDGSNYWNLFNIEGESSQTAQYVTYNTLNDLLNDTNRLNVYDPNSFDVGRNIVGSGSDGSSYWSLFNIEEESSQTAQYVLYDSLLDMFNDTNRLNVFDPNSFDVGRNIVGSFATVTETTDPTDVSEPNMLSLASLGLLILVARRAKRRQHNAIRLT